jgi:hypothetical protein
MKKIWNNKPLRYTLIAIFGIGWIILSIYLNNIKNDNDNSSNDYSYSKSNDEDKTELAKEILRDIEKEEKASHITITKKEYRKQWPFIYDEVVLSCEGWNKVVIITQHRKYGLNGKGMVDYPEAQKIMIRDSDFPDMVFLGATNDIIQRGLKLCKRK